MIRPNIVLIFYNDWNQYIFSDIGHIFQFLLLFFLGQQSKLNELGTEVDENSKKLADAIILKKKGNGVEAVKLLEQVPSDFESILLRYVLFENFTSIL